MNKRKLLLTIVCTLLTWQLFSSILHKAILPGPIIVACTLFTELLNGKLGIHFMVSLGRVLAGMGVAVLTATPLGLLLGQSKKLNQIFTPLIYILYPIPKVVFVPIIMLLFGIGDVAKIIIIFVILFFQILVLVRDQAVNIRPELINSVRSLGAGRKALFRYVYFPATLPAILTSLRQSVGTAIAVLYIAELFATQSGLGYYIYFQGSTLFNYPAMYAGVVAMSLLGLGMYFGIDLLEKRMCSWLFAV